MNNQKRKLIRKHKLVTDRVKHESSKVFTLLVPQPHYSLIERLSIFHGVTPDCLIRAQIKHLADLHNHKPTDTLYFQNEINDAKRSAQDV